MDHGQLLFEQQKEIYNFYNSRIRDVVSFIETEFKRFPVPVLKEIRDAQDHLARCFDEEVPNRFCEEFIKKQADAAKAHYLRCLLDCYKYIWYNFGLKVVKKYFWAKLLGNLSDINNGEFITKVLEYRSNAKYFNQQARRCESIDKQQALDYYEKAINNLKNLDDIYEANIKSISWSIKKGMTLKVIAALGWIISLILTIIGCWQDISDFFQSVFS